MKQKKQISKQVIKQMGKHVKKAIKLSLKVFKHHILVYALPFIIIICLITSVSNFLFFHIPKAVNDKKQQKLKEYAINLTDKTNRSDLSSTDNSKIKDFCDPNGEDIKLILKWSDLYAMVILEDSTSLESFNKDKKTNSFAKKRFDKIAKDLAPKFVYTPGKRKVTVKTTETVKDKDCNPKKDKDGKIETKSTTRVVSDEKLYFLKSADTIYGNYNFEYTTKTVVVTDSEGTWTTTSTELASSKETNKFKRLDEYLKKMIKIKDDDVKTIENTRQQFLELSKGIYEDRENGDWLTGNINSSSNMEWYLFGSLNIDPKIMSAVLEMSKKYSIPPWLKIGRAHV